MLCEGARREAEREDGHNDRYGSGMYGTAHLTPVWTAAPCSSKSGACDGLGVSRGNNRGDGGGELVLNAPRRGGGHFGGRAARRDVARCPDTFRKMLLALQR